MCADQITQLAHRKLKSATRAGVQLIATFGGSLLMDIRSLIPHTSRARAMHPLHLANTSDPSNRDRPYSLPLSPLCSMSPMITPRLKRIILSSRAFQITSLPPSSHQAKRVRISSSEMSRLKSARTSPTEAAIAGPSMTSTCERKLSDAARAAAFGLAAPARIDRHTRESAWEQLMKLQGT